MCADLRTCSEERARNRAPHETRRGRKTTSVGSGPVVPRSGTFLCGCSFRFVSAVSGQFLVGSLLLVPQVACQRRLIVMGRGASAGYPPFLCSPRACLWRRLSGGGARCSRTAAAPVSRADRAAAGRRRLALVRHNSSLADSSCARGLMSVADSECRQRQLIADRRAGAAAAQREITHRAHNPVWPAACTAGARRPHPRLHPARAIPLRC